MHNIKFEVALYLHEHASDFDIDAIARDIYRDGWESINDIPPVLFETYLSKHDYQIG